MGACDGEGEITFMFFMYTHTDTSLCVCLNCVPIFVFVSSGELLICWNSLFVPPKNSDPHRIGMYCWCCCHCIHAASFCHRCRRLAIAAEHVPSTSYFFCFFYYTCTCYTHSGYNIYLGNWYTPILRLILLKFILFNSKSKLSIMKTKEKIFLQNTTIINKPTKSNLLHTSIFVLWKIYTV